MGQHALLRRLAPLGAFLIMAALPVKAAIADGMNAENILGQLDDSDAPVWTTNVPNYRPTAQGFDYPMSVALDTATHRLFVSEYYNNRVLEFDLDSSNNLVDHTADHVLGQTTFTGFQYRNTQNGMNTPYGVAIDPGTQRLFVSDTNNNRVIVFDVSSLSDGQNAAYVLGQTNFTLNSSATTQGRMYRPHHCSYDGLNNRLYVADRANNRVLVYDVSTITNGQNAIFVLGQPDFTSNATNTTQNGMSAPYVVEFATATQKLFVADYTNNRVLVYEVASLSDGMNASYVIGQTDFNSNATATTQSGLNGPHGLAFDAGTNRLFVDDFNNSRVLVFDVNTGADGPNAVNVLGQTDFTTGYTGRSQSRFANPRGLAFDQGNNRMYLADSGNQRVIYFNVSAIVNGQNAEDGLGVQDGAGTYNWTMGVYNTPPNARGMSEALDVVLDTSSHRLFISDSRNSRVLGFDLDSNDTIVDRVADHVLGQTTFGNASKNATQNKFYFPIGLDFDPAGRRLFVGDGYNNRILIYDLSGGISDGQNAAHVIGQTNFTNSGTGITQNQLCLPRGLRYDPSLNRLYVADTSNNRVMVFNVSNVTDGMNAINVLGQPDFTTNSVGITQNKMTTPYGLSLDIPGQRLFVAENSGNRVTVFNVSSLANGQNAMNVLGQADFTSSGAATARNGMNAPFGVTHDPVSGRLYVSDYNNNRVLVFDGKTLSNGQNAANVLGQSNFTSGSFATTQNGLYRPTLLTIDSSHHRLFVPEFSNRRVTTFLVDLAPSTSTLTAVTGSSSGQVALSWPSAGDEESQGNLTGNYRIQYATYTATWSNSTTPTNATTLTISTTNAVPGVVQSTTVAGLTTGNMYYFALFTQDNQSNWSDVSNTASAMPPWTVTAAEAVSQPGWIGQGETQRILGTAQVVSDSAAGVTISSVAVRETGAYTGDGNLTNVEVWVSSTGYIDGTAVRLEDASKSFSGDIVAFDQDVTVSTVPLYFIVRADVAGGATEGTFDISMEVYTTANTTNNPLAFTNATDVVAPPSGSPAGLTATAASNLLQVNLSWGAVSGADSYSIFRATYSGVTTADYLLSLTNATTLPDDYIPPTQQMYYKVIATNRAGASSLSNEANATSVDVSALTPNNIYLRAGAPGGYNTGQPAFQQFLSLPGGVFVDMAGNVYISNSLRIYFIPKISGTHFGQSMMANSIYTIAGWLYSGYAGDGGLATSARLNSPQSAIADSAGNVYIADTYNHRIRFVAKTNGTFFGQAMTANNIYTIAGNGIGGYVADDVAATSAQINSPNHVALDVAGNLFISDTNNNRIRFVPKTSGAYFGQSMTANNIYSIAGNGTGGYVADDVAATSTQINAPGNIAVDVTGNLYIADMANHRIRFVPKASGTSFGQAMIANNIYTIAGNGTSGYLADNVAATSTRINNPYGLCVDPNGNITIADKNNHRIRFIPKLSGTNFGQSMTANNIYTIAGNGSSGIVTITDNVTATATRLNGPKGVSTDAAGNIYIADTDSWSRIRMVPKITSNYFGQSMTAGYIYTLAGGVVGYDGEGNIATATRYAGGLMGGVDSNGNIQIVDTTNFRIRFVPKTTGTFFGQSMVANCAYTIAGTGIYTFNNDGGVATTAGLRNPIGASFDSSGNVYIADRDNARIRFIPKSDGTYFGQSRTANHMYTLVGDGTAAFSGDGGPAVSAQISGSQAITVDRDGNLYIADSNNQRIRFIPAADGTYFGQAMTTNYIYTIAGNGSAGYLADNVSATSTQINNPSDVRVDASGNVVIADKTNSRIRFIPTTDGTYFGQSMTANYIYTIAGNSVGGYADNGLATARQLASPSNVDIDVAKNLYIADTLNHRIRFVPNKSGTYFGQAMTANFIYTVVGNGTSGYNGENAVATSKYINSPNALFLTRDHCLYISDANSKIRMIKADDFISPSTSTLTAVPGSTAGTIDLTWPTAGDDMVNLGNLTGNYRIQYATYTASWSTGSTPSNATMVTISTTNATPGSPQSYVATGLAAGLTYYFVLWSGDEVPNWSDVSNTALVYLPPPAMVTLAEAVGQPGWIGQGETQRILGTAQVVSDSAAGVTVSSVTVRETGAYTGDSNLTNVEVWVSSSGYIDGTAVRLDDASKSFSGDIVAFDQDVTVSTVPLYYIVRADVAGGATEGTFDISMEVYTTANTTNSPLAFSNATDVVAPPSGSPGGINGHGGR
jgi:DNA-binding beta-propeller fold protein YncE